MMRAYMLPILTAVFLFPVLAALAVLPYAIHQYRKFGSISKFKTFIVFSFGFYLLCAYFLVILPLPSIEEVAQMTSPRTLLEPLRVVRQFRQYSVLNLTDPTSYIPALKQQVFLQPFFNIMLTLPFGVYLRYLTKINAKQALLAGLALSLFFELTQLSGLYFIYPRPYRLFEVDDLITNTLGAGLGYAVEPLLSFVIPSVTQLNQSARTTSQHVSFTRRLAAYALDWLILATTVQFLSIGWPALTLANYTHYLIVSTSYFVLIPIIWQGSTPGKALVKIRIIHQESGRATIPSLAIRQLLLNALLLANPLFYIPATLVATQSQTGTDIILPLGGLLVTSTAQLLFLLDIGFTLIGKSHQLFYERLTHLKQTTY
ncbi:VanZ family protein [Fundicoccus sp. Sow4_F4]|uniref:VanZ family protein n=1 Tax=Fundicoccus sp. Sow4_F4 TaxID=3438783 RepID=UPI003F8EEF9C